MSQTEDIKDKGQNIKVVLRCRPMTKAESMKDKVAITCVNEKNVEVNYASMGKNAKKSFSFDGVFDTKSSQTEVYDGVVRPVVDEVLQGYNCTVFAYGQTGTGKTHTMEGDVSAAPSGVVQPNAGIIPRAVTQVFKYLEENEFEYTIRISVVELYNEELADLIASSDDGVNAGTLRKLRLMEDPKKGIVLQGVEERAVKDVHDIFNLLESTNKQRRTAETLCNKQSSRSHQIFTLKIFMKEKTIEEEEVIKTGTLNLVDLAGSECVGRSGALGERKKEAGQINQSLLTLGRVITALVEHQPHIPYRESKLTRLLQESLGGKTKTCIIATVSPNSANIEETLGTLDYACRAKNIKNTPEINQVQTKKTMMRDMSKYIADLQEQLKAQRDGNGVYLPTARYEDMQTEIKRLTEAEILLQNEIQEKMKQLQDLQEAFDDTCVQLEGTREELKHTQQTLRTTETKLDRTTHTLHKTQVKLEDTTTVLSEHKGVGEELYSESARLLKQSVEMKDDMGGLWGKLLRKVKVEHDNDAIADSYMISLRQQVDVAGAELSRFHADQQSKFKGLQRLVAEFVVEKNDEVAALQRAVADLHESIKHAMGEQAGRVEAASEAWKLSSQEMQLLAEEAREEDASRIAQCVADVAGKSSAASGCLDGMRRRVAAWAEQIVRGLDESEEEVKRFVEGQEGKLRSLVAQVEADSKAREEAMQQDRAALEFLVTAQEAANLEMKEQMMQDVGKLLGDALAANHAQMSARVSTLGESLLRTEAAMVASQQTTSEALHASLDAVSALASDKAACAARQRAACGKAKTEVVGMVEEAAILNDTTLSCVKQCEENLAALHQQHAHKTDQTVQGSLASNSQLAASTCESIACEAELASKGCEKMGELLQESNDKSNGRGEGLSCSIDDQAQAFARYLCAAQEQMGAMRQHELRLAKDEPTGQTPHKKDVALPLSLPSFRPDKTIIAELRGVPDHEQQQQREDQDDADADELRDEASEDRASPLEQQQQQQEEAQAEGETATSCLPRTPAASERDEQAEKLAESNLRAALGDKEQQQQAAAARDAAFAVGGGARAAEDKPAALVEGGALPSLIKERSLGVKEAREIQAPRVRSARGTGPKEAIAKTAPVVAVGSSRIPSARSARGKENASNVKD